VRRRIADGPGHEWRAGYVVWRNLGERQWEDAVASVLDAVPTDAVWITIDKDVLPEHEALTNWDQGQMPVSSLLAMLCVLGARKHVLGADICGEYSPPRHANLLKRIESRMDQPVHAVTDRQKIDDNMRIDGELARTLFDACATPT
ncbi:MAG: hypothetical protein ACREP2_07330, partial [Rhodanobacteraceae bacterium]